MSKLIVVADSTQIDAFLTCEMYWRYAHRDRLVPAVEYEGANDARNMGSYGHRLLEVYHKQQALGNLAKASAIALADTSIDTETCVCGQKLEDHPIDSCEPKAQRFDLDTLLREQVRQRFIEYTYTYSAPGADFVPLSPDHIEVGFSHNLYEDDEFLFVLEGRIDGIGSLNGMPCIWDNKFQLRKKRLYKKAIQFRNYALVTNARTLIINYISLTKDVSKTTFARDIASFTTPELTWWRLRLIEIFKRMARAQYTNVYEMSEHACSGKYNYQCPYTTLCEDTYMGAKFIQAKRDTLFKIAPAWRPW